MASLSKAACPIGMHDGYWVHLEHRVQTFWHKRASESFQTILVRYYRAMKLQTTQ